MNLIEHFKGKEGWSYVPPRSKRHNHVYTGQNSDLAYLTNYRVGCSLSLNADGKYRLFSTQTCHPGEVCETPKDVEKNILFLKHVHKKKLKVCDCEPVLG